MAIKKADVQAFLEAYADLCKKHGFWIGSHEEVFVRGHGEESEALQRHIAWLKRTQEVQ